MGLIIDRFPLVEVQYGDGDTALLFHRSWIPERITAETIYLHGQGITNYLLSCSILDLPWIDEYIIVRNRVTRPFWWWYIRMEDMLSLWKSATVRTAQIWGLAYREPATVGRWRDIFLVNWIGKRVGLWD